MSLEQINKLIKKVTGDSFAKRTLLKHLRKLRSGTLIVNDGDQYIFGEKLENSRVNIEITIHDQRFYSLVLIKGDLGAGEAYIRGYWSCNNLTELVRCFISNREELKKLEKGFNWLNIPVNHMIKIFDRNTPRGSQKNIEAHYDIGNDLFALFLDKTMMYSSGYFNSKEETLYEGSINKLDRICKKMQLSSSDNVIEIGTGWGGFAIYAASKYGCHVTTTTISKEQYDYVKTKIVALGMQDQITLLYKDYRDLNGKYDKLVSIEMIEAIGHQYLDTYFQQCSHLLKSDGMMLIQAITIADQQYKAATRSTDFIQRYIFPGGFLPSIAAISDAVARKTDMRFFHLEDIGDHYAITLAHWHNRFFSSLEKVRSLGYSDNFIRMWEYYLSYCEGGFRERVIGTVQLMMIKPKVNFETSRITS